jgi:hypothetical protein
MAKSSLWKWLLGGAVVVGGGIALAARSKREHDVQVMLPMTVKAEPNWMNDTWVRNTLMLESGSEPWTDKGPGKYKIVPLSYGTVNGVLMMDFEKPEQLEPAAKILRQILGPEGFAKRKVQIKSGAKTVTVVW